MIFGASPVFYADGTRAGKPCGEGTRQGSAEAGTAACAAIQPALRAADTELKARGGFARADFDDTYLGGPPADVAAALDRFDAAIALVGAELQRAKSAARCGAACELPADFPVPLGVAKRVRWPLKGGHNRKKRPKTSSQGKILCTRVRKMKRSTEVCWAHYPRSFGVAPFIFRTHLQHASSFLSEIVLFARVEPRS